LHAPPHGYNYPSFSPDGEHLAVQYTRPGLGTSVGVLDLVRGSLTQLTFKGNNVVPVWTRDGKLLTFRSNAYGREGIYTIPADGSRSAALLTTENKLGVPGSWSPDGKSLIGTGDGQREIWLFSAGPDYSGGETRSLLASPAQKRSPMISPDGLWFAYASDETGQDQVYVQSFPSLGARATISTDGGTSPRWSRDGHELFYRSGNKMMVVEIRTSPAFRAGPPRMLFDGQYAQGYDVSPDGKRFLMIRPGPEPAPQKLEVHVIVNWFEELRRLALPGK